MGEIKEVAGEAAVIQGDKTYPASPGQDVFLDDTIETGNDGSVGITFIDNTLTSIGPNTSLTIDEFVFDPGTQEGSILMDLTKGSLSLVSGLIAKASPDAVKVRTPDAIMGLRGTRLVIEVK